MQYAKQWRDDVEWMSQVEAFKGGASVWHMHPVIFLSALSQVQKKNIIFPLKVKPKNDVEGVWKRYYWAAALTGANASQAIFGRVRSGGARKHAARDLYTDPSTEIVAVSNGVVKNISHYYYGTWQVTVEHTIDDGRHFYIRYGEVDPKSIVVKVGDHLTQGMVIAKTGLMINPATGQHPNILPGQVVYMLHFEYYPGNATTPPPNNTPTPPYHRREDLCDPLDILQEGYWNTFCDGVSNIGERIPISNLSVSSDGKVFIKGWEDFKSKAYNDSEGFCTIGYGHLIARAKCEEITLSNEFKSEITIDKADELFESRLSVYVDELKRTVTVNLYQYEFDALISLLFNLGRMSKAPQLNSKLNSADYNGAATEFLDITNGGVSGLVKRRQKEQGLFLNGVYDSSHS
jgi:GH24 family phage-related lysozyme (muramidase)